MARSTPELTVTPEQGMQIAEWVAAMGTPQQVALRCRIVCALAEGETESAVASKLDINRKTVRLWRQRFVGEGLNSLWEIAPGRGRKATYGPERIKAVIDATLQSKPKGNTHWSCRLMAASQGMSKSTVSNLWQSHNIKPHQTKTFKLSRDPKFLEKLTDVVGLYLNPPDKAIVLCVDEKSQIQALNRTQPGLPLKKGRCGTMTHDYKRNGTTTLFAALDLLAGKVIGTRSSSGFFGTLIVSFRAGQLCILSWTITALMGMQMSKPGSTSTLGLSFITYPPVAVG